MENIRQKYEQVQKDKLAMGGAKLFSNAGKNTCEWDTLGATQKLLSDAGFDAPNFARKTEAPDFYTYVTEDGQKLWAPVEIVDVLRPGYKMHEFHVQDAKPDAPLFYHYEGRDVLRDLWQPLREQITRKAKKNYPIGTCLMVYFNIGRFSFPNMDVPFHESLLAEHVEKPLAELSKFGSVLVLDSAMKSLVQLYPTPQVVVPDRAE